ncbi:MAG: ATP-dependent helicase HrpB [Treponema sp.]|nr:ATP-dependent helicase HrpB [Treponema sp.]
MICNNSLPVTPFIPQIAETLKKSPSRFLILTAETGAGKSTMVPAGLSEFFNGKILMTEPRRIAALSIAERVSEILGEPCGKTCGYKIHLENKTSRDTKIEVVTEAILSRTLQNDPSLESYSVILIDEFHERSVTTDLNLAFLREAMELRDDLYVIIMSATIETKKLSEYLGGHELVQDKAVPVMEIPGRTFPVEVEYKPDSSMVRTICDELENAKKGQSPVILAFLPGIKEIRRTESELRNALGDSQNSETEIHVLHSSVSLSDQKKIFTPLPENKKRVIISSAIAETSLTVPGVTTVIDSGLSRVNRLNIALGMETLVTEAESEFSAEQRKGRAGRLQAGRCIRLWNKNEPRQKSMLPEILRTDISSLVLECAAWGKQLSETEDFFLDSPSRAAIKTAAEFLQNMNFLDSSKKITDRGHLALETGVSPRLANLILFAAENPSLKEDAVSLILKYSNYADSKSEMQNRFCEDIRSKITRAQNEFSGKQKPQTTLHKTALLFAGFSDRLAKKCPENSSGSDKTNNKISYQFPNGHTAFLAKDLNFSQAPNWIIAPEVLATGSGGTIFDYECVTNEEAEELISNLVHEETECFFNEDQTKISKFVYTKYGKITLSEKRVNVTKDDAALAWCTQIHKKGLNSLNLSHKIQDFLTRADFYAVHADVDSGYDAVPEGAHNAVSKGVQNAGTFSPSVTRLEAAPEEWLTPFLTDGKLTDEILYNAAYWYLDGATIDANVPTQMILENGRKAKVTYELNSSPEDKTKLIIRPVIEIIIQRIFGCFESPKIMGVPVLLKLLSPASRPLQITEDLAGFWNGSWIEICKEMKGRYPKHNWDYRVAEKE